jgi:hypothetical protein
MAKIKIIDTSIVDGKQWYSIICDQEITRWLYERDSSAYHYIAAVSSGMMIFDIPESTYIVLKIVWSN